MSQVVIKLGLWANSSRNSEDFLNDIKLVSIYKAFFITLEETMRALLHFKNPLTNV